MWNKIVASLQFLGGLILWFISGPGDACVALLMGIFWLLMEIVDNTKKRRLIKMTEQEIEKLARKGWQDLHERTGVWRSPTGDEWEYYLQAWKDSISALYTEEDMRMCWQQGYSNGLLYDMDDDIAGPRLDYSQWIEQLKQQRS